LLRKPTTTSEGKSPVTAEVSEFCCNLKALAEELQLGATVRPESAQQSRPSEGSPLAMDIVASHPTTAAPAAGGTAVESTSPEVRGYSKNAASRPNNVADPPAGEKAARFERAVVPLREPLYRHALGMCHNRADAEDLVQDTMVKGIQQFSFLRAR
jgi:hypothetical protein